MEDTYIKILIDSLLKKKEILNGIVEQTARQEKILAARTLDIDAFNEHIDNKEKLIEALEKMDAGFDDIYNRIKDILPAKKEEYKSEVLELQGLITEVTELGLKISRMEEHNRAQMTLKLSEGKQRIKDFKLGRNTAAAYYRNMAGRHQDGESYFMDKKK